MLSVLAMTSAPTTRDTLKYRKLGTKDALGSWGHEYVRCASALINSLHRRRSPATSRSFLTADVIKEFTDRFQNGVTSEEENADLHTLAAEIVPFCMAHNAEADAADLLMELETIDRIVQHVDEKNYERVCLYLISCVSYVPEPEDQQVLRAVLAIYRRLAKWPEALLISLRLFDIEGVQETIASCTDPYAPSTHLFDRVLKWPPSFSALFPGSSAASSHLSLASTNFPSRCRTIWWS